MKKILALVLLVTLTGNSGCNEETPSDEMNVIIKLKQLDYPSMWKGVRPNL